MNQVRTNVLSEEQTASVLALEETCRLNDGLKGTVFLSHELNFNKDINSFYLLYDEDKLVSFLSLFIPTQKEAEVSGFTLPKLRHHGLFRSLLQSAEEELKRFDIPRLLFVHEPQSTDTAAVVKHYGARYEFSEYLLAFDRSTLTKIQNSHPEIRLERAVLEQTEEIAMLSSRIFEEDFQESFSMVEKSMLSPGIECYGAFLGNQMIGMCTLNLKKDKISIFGVGISPEVQGKGYGRQMLGLLLTDLAARESREITLSVNSTNAAAYHLYLTTGFQVKTQFDYASYMIQ